MINTSSTLLSRFVLATLLIFWIYLIYFDLQHQGSMDLNKDSQASRMLVLSFKLCQFVWGISGTLERLDLWVQRVAELVTEKLLYGRSWARMAVAFCWWFWWAFYIIFLFHTLFYRLWSEDVWLSSSGWTNSFWTHLMNLRLHVTLLCVRFLDAPAPEEAEDGTLKPKVRMQPFTISRIFQGLS